MNFMNPVYALCSVLLFITAAHGVFMFGSEENAGYIILSLFTAAVGQYMAQSDNRHVVTAATILTTLAIGMAFMIVVEVTFL